jgi:2-polyprenyl-3-methyl-5-hydroxy-6-metoxy-1,4-benzoquinol methylase
MNKVPKSVRDWQRYQYEVEKDYAKRIISSPKDSNDCKKLFEEAYRKVIGEIIEKYNPGGGGTLYRYPGTRVSIVRNLVKEGRILEIGCGDGELIVALIQDGYKVKGIDVAKDCIERAKKKLSSILAENSVEHIDILDYQTNDTFDCIVMDNVIEHIVPDTTDEVLKKCYNLLNIRGYLVLLTTHRFSCPHDISKLFLPFGAKAEGLHLKEFSFIDLEDALGKAGFQQVFGFPFHPRLLWKFNIVPRPSVWAARKARFFENILERDSLSKMLTINRTLTRVMVATLFPAIAVGAKNK